MVQRGFHQSLVLCTGAVLLLHVAALASLQGTRPVVAAAPGAAAAYAVQSRWIPAEAPDVPAGPVPRSEVAQAAVADRPPDPIRARVPGATGAARTAAEADYLPRALLSLVPVALAPIPIDYPAIEGDAGRYRAVLALFIDEGGRVRRVRAEGPALPAPLEEAARTAFMTARFSPGQVNGAAVRSLIRVEVSFDHRAAR